MTLSTPPEGGGGITFCYWPNGNLLPHFHNWIDYNGVALSTEFVTNLLEGGRKLSGF